MFQQGQNKSKLDGLQMAERLYGGGENGLPRIEDARNDEGIPHRVRYDKSNDGSNHTPSAIASTPLEKGNDKEQNHKAEILATRKGGFGSSDAAMIIDIATTGKIYKTEHLKRLAVFEGLIEPDNFTNKYMEVGNQREKEIFDWFCKTSPNAKCQHNPRIEICEGLFETHGFKLFSHIDIVARHNDANDENEGSYEIIEVKTSQEPIEVVFEKYRSQLLWHVLMSDFRYALDSKITLIHYEENFNNEVFDADKVTMRCYRFSDDEFSNAVELVREGLRIIKDFLTTQRANDYADLREVCKEKTHLKTNENEISEGLSKLIDKVTDFMRFSMEMEKETTKLKAEILKIMTDKDIAKWELKDMIFTKVKDSVSVSFDSKKFEKEHPALYKQYYTKETSKKSYLTIKLKEVENIPKNLIPVEVSNV